MGRVRRRRRRPGANGEEDKQGERFSVHSLRDSSVIAGVFYIIFRSLTFSRSTKSGSYSVFSVVLLTASVSACVFLPSHFAMMRVKERERESGRWRDGQNGVLRFGNAFITQLTQSSHLSSRCLSFLPPPPPAEKNDAGR